MAAKKDNAGIYFYKQEVWDKEKCEKLCKYTHADGMGTKYGFKGYVGHLIVSRTIYNGGTIINDKLYRGIDQKLPKLAPGYKLVNRISWGWTIVKDEVL